MADTLTEWWHSLDNANQEDSYAMFAAGVTKGAVSMRERAIKIVQDAKLKDNEKNDLLTKVGTLADIP